MKSCEKKKKDWISGQQGNKTVNKEALKGEVDVEISNIGLALERSLF